jgi:thioredoxin 2
MVAPEIAKVASQGTGRWLVAKVNTEELPGLAQRLRITAIPLLAVFKGGRELARKAGVLPAAMIRQFVELASETGGG